MMLLKILKNSNIATRIEIAAPIVPYIETKTKKEIKKVPICKSPLNTNNLDLSRLLSFDIRFAVMAEGIIVMASILKLQLRIHTLDQSRIGLIVVLQVKQQQLVPLRLH
jgi:hypothetical protein